MGEMYGDKKCEYIADKSKMRALTLTTFAQVAQLMHETKLINSPEKI